MEQLSTRFNRCSLRDDAEHVANLAADLGEEALQYLAATVRGGPVAEAVEMTGLLSKLDPQAVWSSYLEDSRNFRGPRRTASFAKFLPAARPRRCQILLELLDHVDPLVMPLVIDEIGVAADREALGKLLTIADGDLPAGASAYLRVKAVEALGRIQRRNP